eukprot:1160563-Pelagomonas_calceolata.AAC.17
MKSVPLFDAMHLHSSKCGTRLTNITGKQAESCLTFAVPPPPFGSQPSAPPHQLAGSKPHCVARPPAASARHATDQSLTAQHDHLLKQAQSTQQILSTEASPPPPPPSDHRDMGIEHVHMRTSSFNRSARAPAALTFSSWASRAAFSCASNLATCEWFQECVLCARVHACMHGHGKDAHTLPRSKQTPASRQAIISAFDPAPDSVTKAWLWAARLWN